MTQSYFNNISILHCNKEEIGILDLWAAANQPVLKLYTRKLAFGMFSTGNLLDNRLPKNTFIQAYFQCFNT